MTPRLVQSALFATGAHALLLIPVGLFAGVDQAAQTDVMRGASAVELELVGPSEQGTQARIFPEGEDPLPPTGRPAEQWEQDPGAQLRLEPGVLSNPAPLYPRIARVQGWEGTVILRAFVSSTGSVQYLSVYRSSGHPVLDEAAAAAVRQWRFKPAVRSGRRAATLAEVPVTFRLKAEESSSTEGRN